MKKKMCGFLAGLLCLSMLCAPVFAEENDALKAQLNDSVQKIKDMSSQMSSTQSDMAEIEKQINASNAAIDAINAQIADLDERMAGRKAQIAVLQEQQDKQEKELEERLRVMYMYGNDGYLQVLFSSNNFTDFIARADMMKNVMQADKDAVTALENTKKEIEAQNAGLEADKAVAEEAKAAQTDAKNQQDALLAKNQALVDELKANIAAEQAAADNIAQQMGFESASAFVQTGEYYWPISPDNSQAFWISSPFAGRIHPITGEWSNHQGVDVAVSYGTPILAAGDGTVSIAGWNGGYGECVVINMGTDGNGNKLATLYGHMSQIATTVGATVSKGDIIGYVGSTGNSTGPHLHFGWMVNGEYTDPLAYYPDKTWNYVE